MKFSIAAAAAAVLASSASAAAVPTQNTAIVKSNCPFPVYLQSFPYGGGQPGTFTILKPGDAAYVESYKGTGSTIKLSNKRTLASPLFFGYTNEADEVYYELNTDNGNPFAAYRNKLIPSAPQCKRFNCGPDATSCYSQSHNKVPGCDKPVSLTLSLCTSQK